MSNYIITLGYSNAAVFKAGMQSLNKTVIDTHFNLACHYILDQHYPLNYEEVRATLEQYERHPLRSAHLMDAGRNLGLHEGLNYMLDGTVIDEDDVVICFDADENPLDVGWAQAMVDVFAADKTVGWLSLMAPPCRDNLDDHKVPIETIAGVKLRFPGYSLMNTVVGWSGRALKAMGPMREPHAFYGGIEGAMQPKCMKEGFRVGWLNDYNVVPHHDLADPEYRLYKQHHVGHRLPEYKGPFDQWLRDRGCL